MTPLLGTSRPIFPGNSETLQLCVLVVPDCIQDMLWPALGQVLDDAAFDALHDRTASERVHVRKSDSRGGRVNRSFMTMYQAVGAHVKGHVDRRAGRKRRL